MGEGDWVASAFPKGWGYIRVDKLGRAATFHLPLLYLHCPLPDFRYWVMAQTLELCSFHCLGSCWGPSYPPEGSQASTESHHRPVRRGNEVRQRGT